MQTRLGYSRTDARFTAGTFSGKTVPLVPAYKTSASISWNTGPAGTYGAAINQVGARYFSGDLNNGNDKLGGYLTADLQASWNLRPWTITARLMNAFNQKYAPFGVLSAAGAPAYYPADGRTAFVTAHYDFR